MRASPPGLVNQDIQREAASQSLKRLSRFSDLWILLALAAIYIQRHINLNRAMSRTGDEISWHHLSMHLTDNGHPERGGCVAGVIKVIYVL
jgi:hypothetical protein